jgi:hypothetical protein
VRKGLESLTPDEKRQLPELVLDDKAHRAWFEATMDEMGGAEAHGTDDKANKDNKDMPSPERIYTAQVLWDETMAEGATKWSKASPRGTLVLLAGNGHCHDSAIVNRIKRRGVDKVISVRPVLDVEGNVAAALAKPVNDYLVVLELPKKSASAAHGGEVVDPVTRGGLADKSRAVAQIRSRTQNHTAAGHGGRRLAPYTIASRPEEKRVGQRPDAAHSQKD